jgi:hypothetical protein
VFENRVLRGTSGPKRNAVTGEWRKLHNEELRDLYSLSSINRMSKVIIIIIIIITPWPSSASELHRPSDRRLSAKLVSTFADRGCRVVSAMDPYSRILGFLDRDVTHVTMIICNGYKILDTLRYCGATDKP